MGQEIGRPSGGHRAHSIDQDQRVSSVDPAGEAPAAPTRRERIPGLASSNRPASASGSSSDTHPDTRVRNSADDIGRQRRMRDFGREQDLGWLRSVPTTRRESERWGTHDPDAWSAGMVPAKYERANYMTMKEVFGNKPIWNTDRALGELPELAGERLREPHALPLSDDLTVGCLSTGPGRNEMLTVISLAQRLHVPIRALTNYEPVAVNRTHGAQQWQRSIERERAIGQAAVGGDMAAYRRLVRAREKEDRTWLYAKILGIDLTAVDHAGIDGKPVEPDWQPLDVFSPPPEMFESLDVATDFYGSCSYTDSPARFAATMITKMRMLKPGGLLIGVNEAVTGVWKGYGTALPGANVPPHVMRAIFRILDPKAKLKSIELDTDTTDDHVPATIINSVLQKSEDFEERLPEIRQKLVDLLSLPGSLELDGMDPPRASQATREFMANKAIVPLGAIQPFEDDPPILLALMRDAYGTQQVHALRNWREGFDPADAVPLTSFDSSVVHAEIAPGNSSLLSVVDHRGVVILQDVVDGDERSIEAFSRPGERQLGPWSPDGKQFIVTSARVDQKTGRRSTEIHVVDVDHPDAPRLLLSEADADWTCNVKHSDDMQIGRTFDQERRRPIAWTKQGTLLAVCRREGESDGVWEIDPATGNRQCLVGPNTDHELNVWARQSEGRYERVESDAQLAFDLLAPGADNERIGIHVRTSARGGSLGGWIEPARSADNDSDRSRLWLHDQFELSDRLAIDDGTIVVMTRDRGPLLSRNGTQYDLNHPYETSAAGHPRGYSDPTGYGEVVAIGRSAIMATVSPLRGPALARVDTEKFGPEKSGRTFRSAIYDLLQISPPRELRLARPRYAAKEEPFTNTALGALTLPSRAAMARHEVPLPVLVWLGNTDELVYPAWMEKLVEEFGIAVLVPDLPVPLHRIAAGKMSDEERPAVVAQLHQHIEALRVPSVEERDWLGLIDGARIMVAGDTLVSELLAAHPGDAIAAAVLANADDPLPGLGEAGYDGPLFVAGNSRQIGAIAQLAGQWRDEGRQVVTVNAGNERGGRFEAADNQAALRLALTTFFSQAVRRHGPGAPKTLVADRHPLLPRSDTWLSVDSLSANVAFGRFRRIRITGKTANRLGREATAELHPDTTEKKPKVIVTSHDNERRCTMTVELDLEARRAVVADVRNPPPIEPRHVGKWSSLIAEAIRPYDITEVQVGPLDMLPMQRSQSGLPFFFAETVAGAFRSRGVTRGNLYFRTEPAKDDPHGRYKVVVRRGIGKARQPRSERANA